MAETLKPGWRRIKLGSIAVERTEREDNPPTSVYDRYVGSDDIARFEWAVRRWRPASEVTSAAKVFHPGDYLFVRRSLYASDFRERAALADFSGLCSGDILPIREKPGTIAPGFLSAVLNHPRIWAYVVKHATGSITKRIKWRDLAEYEVALPPMSEQRRISQALTAVDRLADAFAACGGAARNAKNALATEVFLRSEGQQNVPLAQTCNDITVGIVVQPARWYVLPPEGVPALLMKNVRRGWLDLSDVTHISTEGHQAHAKSALRKGDVVAVRSSGSAGRTGDAAVVPAALEGANCIDLLIARPNAHCVPDYLVAYLNSPTTRQQLVASSSGTMQKHLNVSAFRKLVIPMPSVVEQQRIVAELSGLEDAARSADERCSELTAFKGSLFRALDGEVS